jgi:hypothetical protein
MKKNFSGNRLNELLESVERRTITDEQLRTAGIYVWCIPMPSKIRAYSEKYQDIYLVYINQWLCEAGIYRALQHELMHIVRNDFDREGPVEAIEGKLYQEGK